jgi:cyclophilin family peptidyl-prolyl cis-trans isomerase
MSDEPIVTTKENLAWFQTRRKSWQNAPRPKLKPLPPTRTIASGNDTTNNSSSTTNTTRTTVTTDAPTTTTTTIPYPTNQSASIAAPGPATATVTPRRIVSRISKGGDGFSANRSEGNNTAIPSSNPFAGIQLISSSPSVTVPTVSATASATHLGAVAAESSSAGPDASSSPASENSSRARLIAFYQKHNPEKLDSVDTTLLKFQGNEDELFRKLEAKYAATKPISTYPPPGGEGPMCFLKFSIGGKPPGTVTVKLYEDKVPLACQNFLALCTGSKGMGRMGQPLCYKNSKNHRVVPSFCVQAGDFTRGDGTGGESIFEPNTPGVSDSMGRFKDEMFMRHSKKGLLSMANNGPNRNGSQFFFTLRSVVSLDGKHVVFGEVTSGLDVVEQIGMLETTPREQPRESVVIVDCGEIVDGKEISCELGEAKTATLPPFSIGTTVSSISPSPAIVFGAGSSTQPTPFSFGSISASLPIGDGFGSKTHPITENTTKGPSPFGFGANMNGGGSSLFSFGGLKSSIPTSGGAFGTQPTESSSMSKSSDQSKNLAAPGFGVAAGPSPSLSFGALASGTSSTSGVGFGGVSSSNSSAPSFGLGASASRPSIPFGSTTTATTTTSTFSFGSLSNQVPESSFPSGVWQPSTASPLPSRTRPPIGDFRDGTLSGAESDSDDDSS